LNCVILIHGIKIYFSCFRLSREEIKLLGKWLKDKIDISYLADLPSEILVVQSGIPKEHIAPPTTRDDWYHLPRQRVHVPDALRRTIFTWIESQESKIHAVNHFFFKSHSLFLQL
jgi:hypothetical protein